MRVCAAVTSVFSIAACVGSMRADTSLESVTAIVGASVIPMAGDIEMLADHTVLVVDGRIAQMGPSSEVRIPAGARRIEADGQFLIPGLADMHVHLEYFRHPDVLKLFLANGVTTVRNMDGRPDILDWKQRVADGSLEGPMIYTAGPLLDGEPPIFPDNTIVSTPAEAREVVRAQVAAGYDFVKVYVNLPADAYRAVLAEAAELGMPVVGHVPRAIELGEALTGTQVSIEHLADYGDWIEATDSPFADRWHWSKLYLAMPSDVRRISTAASRIASSGTWTVPTLIQAHRALAPEDSLSIWEKSPAASYLHPDQRARWLDQIRGLSARMDEGDWAMVAEGRENRLALVSALHRAGAHILAGTDTPNPFVVPGFSLHEELQMLAHAGLTPVEALAAATRDAAVFQGALLDWGTIGVGRRADLVLLRSSPLETLASLEHIVGVMLRGTWFSEADLREMLTDLKIE